MTKAYSYIRMSTEAQLDGRSLPRQIEKSEKWASEHGLTLDTEINLRDIGVSAFDGSNIEKGQLGKFLQAIEEGRIEKGSYLLIESLDRLTRQNLHSALSLFLRILGHGIYVVTLGSHSHVYAPELSDPTSLFIGIIELSRANSESQHKSERVSDAWHKKQDGVGPASGRVITSISKGWLKLRPDGTGFDPIPGRAEIVRRIFSDAADHGMGAYTITRRLNQEGVPPFGRSTGWQPSYVKKILKDRSVLGEYQPHTKKGGKRRPRGEPRQYYPPIIDEQLFYRAQKEQHSRRIGSSGRKGHDLKNLFSGLARCGVCKGPII